MYVHLDARYRQNRTGLLTRVANHIPVGFYTSQTETSILTLVSSKNSSRDHPCNSEK